MHVVILVHCQSKKKIYQCHHQLRRASPVGLVSVCCVWRFPSHPGGTLLFTQLVLFKCFINARWYSVKKAWWRCGFWLQWPKNKQHYNGKRSSMAALLILFRAVKTFEQHLNWHHTYRLIHMKNTHTDSDNWPVCKPHPCIQLHLVAQSVGRSKQFSGLYMAC